MRKTSGKQEGYGTGIKPTGFGFEEFAYLI